VNPRPIRLAQIISVLYTGLGIWALAKTEYAFGAFLLVAAVVWLAMAALKERRSASRSKSERGVADI
jgi:hypothetical protein